MKHVLLLLSAAIITTNANAQKAGKEKTAFQTSSPWRPEIDVRSDVAIVYGPGDRKGMSFQERVDSWRKRGYTTHFMTGIAWGRYDEYFLGKWDGKNHLGIVQVTRDGDSIWHGKNTPYVVPVEGYVDYMKRGVVKKVIDAGINSIYLEEPEFWARAGYSDPFKEEWQKYYGFPWRPQHESPENTYLSNKLKYQLYFNAIKQVSEYAKSYGKSKGMDVKVYIPTHSLVNYSSWQIVSPEASLASLPGIDGYIAQVWTGTSREPTFFNGVEKERVFENAFLEYGSMVSMTAPTGRKMFFLTDPIEDWPRDWSDYKKNYEATFTAKLLYPMVADYEVMPWPERIYTRPYKIANSDEKVLIPKYYSTQMQIMINALNDMPRSDNKVSGNNDIGVLMSNSLMFQRFPTHQGFQDSAFSNFYGQTFPLLKRGVPVQTVHMENLAFANTLKNIKVLVVSYSNMKPNNAKVHEQLADWVRKGGVLIYCGRDDDPYQTVMEWWNTKGKKYKAPSDHLFELLKVNPDDAKNGKTVGKGTFYVLRMNPKELVMQAGEDADYIGLVKDAYENRAKAGRLLFKNFLSLQRGPFDLVSVMDESVGDQSFVISDLVIDLFDPKLPVLTRKEVKPGTQAFLYNLKRAANTKPHVLAAASRVYEEKTTGNSYAFVAKSPVNTINAMRAWLPKAPSKITVLDPKGQAITDAQSEWNAESNTLFLGFNNEPDGVRVKLEW